MLEKPTSDFSPVETMMMQGLAFQVLRECLALNLFDGLEEFQSAGRVAASHGFGEMQAAALLDMLAANGFLESRDGGYRNLPMASEYFVSTSPFYQGKSLFLHDRFNTMIQDGLVPLLRGEQQSKEQVDDGWGAEDAMQGTAQHAKLGPLQDTVRFITELPGFSSMKRMADIGGNHGEFCMGAVDANPGLRAEILDLPGVVETATVKMAATGYADRITPRVCDLNTDRLEEGGYDLVLASHILYGFVDRLDELASMIALALKPGGWFVAQHLSPENDLPVQYVAGLDLITRLSGYKSHFLAQEQLERALTGAGLLNIRTAATGMHGSGLIVAAQKNPR